MKTRTLLRAAAIAPLACAALLMSCSDQDIPTDVVDAIDGKIQFLPGTSNQLAGRATPVNGTNYLDTDIVPDMKVWAFFAKDAAAGSGIQPGAQYVGQAGDGVTISNVSSGGTAKWDYANPDETAYWPNQPLDFLAMIPAADPSFTSTAEVTNDVAKATAEVNVPTDQSQQKDILFAFAQGLSGRTAQANDPVSLTFSHALSQITFSGKVKASNVTVVINGITINNVDAKGTVGFTSDDSSIPLIGSIPATGADRLTADYSPGLIASATLSGAEDIDQAKNLTAGDGALMLIPQIRTSDKWEPTTQTTAQGDAVNSTYLSVSCKIKAGDVYLVGNASDYANIYLPLDISWEPGKHYDYTIVFGAANDNGGGFDDNGNPIDQMLPVSYSVLATGDWKTAEKGDEPASVWIEGKDEWEKGLTGATFNPFNGMPIVLYNSVEKKKEVITPSDYNLDDYPKSSYTPIGVVVIPKYHTGKIYPDGDPAKGKDIMISLKGMNYNSPDVGGDEIAMYWGGRAVDIPEMENYLYVGNIQNTTEGEYLIYKDPIGLIPSEKFNSSKTREQSVACPGTYYASKTTKCPCPYFLEDGKYKPYWLYRSSKSATRDFSGRVNTQIMCSMITVSDWQTSETITNYYGAGNYPAAACCARYRTIGTLMGDWYMPGGGEIGYMMPFFDKIQQSLNKINNVFGGGTAICLNNSGNYSAACEYSWTQAYRMHTGNGNLMPGEKKDAFFVRAYCIVE